MSVTTMHLLRCSMTVLNGRETVIHNAARGQEKERMRSETTRPQRMPTATARCQPNRTTGRQRWGHHNLHHPPPAAVALKYVVLAHDTSQRVEEDCAGLAEEVIRACTRLLCFTLRSHGSVATFEIRAALSKRGWSIGESLYIEDTLV